MAPLVAMRTFAEESRAGSLDLLRAVPVAPRVLVLGKWLATWMTVLAVVAPSLVLVALVRWWGRPDAGPIVAGYVGLALLAAALCGLGVLASSFTTSQPVAAMTTFFVALLLWFSHVGADAVNAGGFLARLSLSERLHGFASGVIGSADVGFFVLLLTTSLVLCVQAVHRAGPTSRVRRVVVIVVILFVALVAERALDRWHRDVDLTANRSLTLSSQTREVVRRLGGDVHVTAFMPRSAQGRAEAAALLDRYHRLDRRIQWRLLDPETSPGETRRLGVDASQGGIALAAGDRVEHAPIVSEQDVTAGLARLLRPEATGVCVATGHGEPDPGGTLDDDLGGAIGSLVANGYRIRLLDLLVRPEVPSDCRGLLVAGAQVPLGDDAVAAVARYLAEGGRALVLAEAGSTVKLDSILAPYGLALERGLVFEGDPNARLGNDAVTPVVRTFSSSSPVVRQLPPAVFPGAQALRADAHPRAGLTTTVIAASTRLSYLERDPAHPHFDPGADVEGPLALAAAADFSEVRGRAVHRTRLIVVGDVTFATNGFLGEGGNSRFLIQAMDWLTLDEDLVSVSTHLPAYRPLELTAARLRYARFVAVGVIPGLFALAGSLVWAVRRSR
jgi:hypothetical protein